MDKSFFWGGGDSLPALPPLIEINPVCVGVGVWQVYYNNVPLILKQADAHLTLSTFEPLLATCLETPWGCLIRSLKSVTHWMTVKSAGTM